MIQNGKIKHIMWDWNGTLMNDTQVNVMIINPILERVKVELLTLESYRNKIDFPVQTFYHRLGIDPNVLTYEQFVREFFEIYDARRFECLLFEQAKETLESFKLAGLSQSILSAHQEKSLKELVKFYDIEHYFLDITAAKNQAGEGKVAMGLEKIERLGLVGQNVLIIGDTAHDYEVAQAIGAQCILLSHGYHTLERLNQCNAPIVHSMNELREAVLQKIIA